MPSLYNKSFIFYYSYVVNDFALNPDETVSKVHYNSFYKFLHKVTRIKN
jgi:hypothetical protein